MTISQICQRDVDLVDQDESAWAAAERMHQRSVGSLIVLDRYRQPIGIVTDRDLVVKVLAAEKSPRTTRVRDIMAAPVKTVLETSTVEWTLSLMRSGEVRRLPVVDGEGRLVGVVTLDDVLSLLASEFSQIGHLLDCQAPRRGDASWARNDKECHCMNGIPVLVAEGDCIARAWENSLIRLFNEGCDISTQYDKPEDPPSKDATMIITVTDPLAEPMIHRDLPGGFEDLQEYVMEVCDGIKDHWVRDASDADRHALGIHLPPAAVRLRGALADEAHRPDRRALPAVGQDPVHPPRPGDHVESLGGQRMLRSGLPAEHLVPDC